MTRSLAARTRVLAASAALLLAVGALAGCSDHPGQVADMHYTGLDGARHSVVVSEKDVDVVVKELDSALGWENLERQGVNRPQIAGLLVEAPYLTEVGQAHGLTVTDAQIVEMVKKQVGFEPRKPETLTYLRATVLSGHFQQLSQHPEQAGQQGKVALADLDKVRGTLDGDLSPRYSNKAQTWLTRTDPRLEAGNNPLRRRPAAGTPATAAASATGSPTGWSAAGPAATAAASATGSSAGRSAARRLRPDRRAGPDRSG